MNRRIHCRECFAGMHADLVEDFLRFHELYDPGRLMACRPPLWLRTLEEFYRASIADCQRAGLAVNRRSDFWDRRQLLPIRWN